MRFVFILAFAAVALPLVACPEVPMPTTLRRPARCPLTLGPEDVVTVRVVGEADLSGEYQSDIDGVLDFPYVGRIDVRGKTITSLSDHIATGLRTGEYILEPQVSVVIKAHNSARVVVDGQVTRPGSFPFRTGLTLLEAIGLAGGRTPIADRRQIRLTRSTGSGTTTDLVPLRAINEGREDDISLCPGDAIYVPETVL
jgi:polysaccharide export outer membrane protein